MGLGNVGNYSMATDRHVEGPIMKSSDELTWLRLSLMSRRRLRVVNLGLVEILRARVTMSVPDTTVSGSGNLHKRVDNVRGIR